MQGIEARTLLDPFVGGDASIAVAVGAEVAMAEDGGLWSELEQELEKLNQGSALGWGTCVGWSSVIRRRSCSGCSRGRGHPSGREGAGGR